MLEDIEMRKVESLPHRVESVVLVYVKELGMGWTHANLCFTHF